MEKEKLKQYNSHVAEMIDLEAMIEKMQADIDRMKPESRIVTDVVTRGKKGKKPLGTCTIRGTEDHRKLYRKKIALRKRKAKRELLLAKIEEEIMDAEDYIDSLPDSETRRILRFKCIEGDKRTSWAEVAEKMGEGYTAENCKQVFSRFMREK